MVTISLARILVNRSSETTDLGPEPNGCHFILDLSALPPSF